MFRCKKKGNDRRYLEQRAVVRGHRVQLVVKDGIYAKNKKNIFSRSGTGTNFTKNESNN